MTDIAHFPRPGQSDPYILTSLTKSYLWSCDAVRTEREETSASHFQLRKIYLKHLSSWKSDWRQSCSKIDIRWKVGKNFFSAEFNCSDHHEITIFSTDTIQNAHSLGKWDNTTADIILSWNIRTFITKSLMSSKQDSFFATTGCWRQEALTRPSTKQFWENCPQIKGGGIINEITFGWGWDKLLVLVQWPSEEEEEEEEG